MMFWRMKMNVYHIKYTQIVLPIHGKCPKILYTIVSDKMAYTNSADPDQIGPEGTVWSGSSLFAIPLSILRNNCIKNKI